MNEPLHTLVFAWGMVGIVCIMGVSLVAFGMTNEDCLDAIDDSGDMPVSAGVFEQ